MKKVLFGIFAHPDDEAFGPCGTLLKESREGAALHLIMLTAGDAGMNPGNVPDLSETRLSEWRAAGQLLGAKGMHFLGYKDGHLDNSTLPEVAERIMTIVSSVLRDEPEDTIAEFICFDFSGLTGHIDHIVATRAACLAYYRLKPDENRLRRIRLFCLPASLHPRSNVDWLYMEKGRDESEIDDIVDARSLKEPIISVMRAHASQSADCEQILSSRGDSLGLDYFVIRT